MSAATNVIDFAEAVHRRMVGRRVRYRAVMPDGSATITIVGRVLPGVLDWHDGNRVFILRARNEDWPVKVSNAPKLRAIARRSQKEALK